MLKMDEMREFLLTQLKQYMKKRKRINLLDLQKWFSGDVSYETFATLINALENEGVLIPVISQKTNGKRIPLYNVYTISVEKLKGSLAEEIHQLQYEIDAAIRLDKYLKLDEAVWRHDLEVIRKINAYITAKGLPKEERTMPERSYELVGDEKWIERGEGRRILERLGLWDKMKITTQADPAMLSINRQQLIALAMQSGPYKHLIVENRSIYHKLQALLKTTHFTSLIYGCGWKITSSLQYVPSQLGLEDAKHIYYYFGDLDYEGIAILDYIQETVIPATPFYEALLQTEPTKGKENQRRRKDKALWFAEFFHKEKQEKIVGLLTEGFYYPQEVLSDTDCKSCWEQLE